MSGGRPSKCPSFLRRALDVRSILAGKDEALRQAHATIAEQRLRIAALKRRDPEQRDPEQRDPEPDEEFPRNAFFVTGRARSGTTWLRSLLNAHPEILCWGEGRVFERSFERPEYARLEGARIPPTSLYGALGRAEYLRYWIENSVWGMGDEPYEEHLKDLTRLAVRHFMEGRLARSGARLVGDKTPYRSAEMMGEIASVLPGARVIHIIRDGRDAAVSFVHHSWNHPTSEGGVYDLTREELSIREAYRSGSLHPPEQSIFTPERLATLATEWSREVLRASEEGRRLLRDDYIEVRYEDLLLQPAYETKRLLDFLGARSGDEPIARCLEKTDFQSGSDGRRPGEEDSASRFRKGIQGDWENVFTVEDRRIFDDIAGSTLGHFGYERTP
ncbi:MAG: sulfotransferase family protein [Rubrobacter sp.]